MKKSKYGDSSACKLVASIRGRDVTVAFWMAFALSASISMARQPFVAIDLLGQVPVAMIWLGYPILVFRCFSSRRTKTVGTLALIGGIVAAALLILFDHRVSAESELIAVAVFLLVLAPFLAAARALQLGERQGIGHARTSMLLGTISFFVLPLLGAFIHSRVRHAIGRQPMYHLSIDRRV